MIKKFHAQTTRDALRQVRDALGASALILSNRQVAGGVEIIAVADGCWPDPPIVDHPRVVLVHQPLAVPHAGERVHL
jgi:flagellar biosynthesis GTPase FlhF